mmetsp:Transcript_29998/g.47659  ORF Transcript_29998/g.47659 Transcript_29998/m.47659 type:complete len:497 (+) Transcript_29998:165-1655(+)
MDILLRERLSGQALEVLDVFDNRDLLRFTQGKWEHAQKDFVAGLGEELAREIEHVVVDRVADALGLRENLVNLKKVYKILYLNCLSLEQNLGRFTSLFFVEGKGWLQKMERELLAPGEKTTDVFAQLYVDASKAFQRSKGLSNVLHDARVCVKNICCVPRHPYKASKPAIQDIPHTFHSCRPLKEFKARFPEFTDEAAKYEGEICTEKLNDELNDGDERCIAVLDDVVSGIQTKLDLEKETAIYIKKVFIARGIAKAFRIEIETERLIRALGQAIEQHTRVLRCADRIIESDFLLTIPVSRFQLVSVGIVTVFKDLKRWLEKIMKNPRQRFFGASDMDASCGLVLPEGFDSEAKEMYQDLKTFIDEKTPVLQSRMASKEEVYERIQGKHKCKRCQVGYARPWIGESTLCYYCEQQARDEAKLLLLAKPLQPGELLKCALGIRCGKKLAPKFKTMCPHSLRCFVCDNWTCEQCQVEKCDGEAALELINDLQPNMLFF